MSSADGETRDGVKLTNLDQPLFGDAGAVKRDLVEGKISAAVARAIYGQ